MGGSPFSLPDIKTRNWKLFHSHIPPHAGPPWADSHIAQVKNLPLIYLQITLSHASSRKVSHLSSLPTTVWNQNCTQIFVFSMSQSMPYLFPPQPVVTMTNNYPGIVSHAPAGQPNHSCPCQRPWPFSKTSPAEEASTQVTAKDFLHQTWGQPNPCPEFTSSFLFGAKSTQTQTSGNDCMC